MIRSLSRAAAVAVAAALLVSATGTAAYADGIEDLTWPGPPEPEPPAFLPPVKVYSEPLGEQAAELADRVLTPAAGVTCDPPVVDGRMVVPGAVAAATAATAVVSAVWSCTSDDTAAAFTVTGTVTDLYLVDGAYRTGPSFPARVAATGGAAVVTPAGAASYGPAGRAANAWHKVRFDGTTSTGLRVTAESRLYYLAAY